MSHPNPSHDRSNEYPEDKVTNYKAEALKKKTLKGKGVHSKTSFTPSSPKEAAKFKKWFQ